MSAQHTPGPWEVREFITAAFSVRYIACRQVNKAGDLHVMQTDSGRERLFRSADAASAAIAKATGGQA